MIVYKITIIDEDDDGNVLECMGTFESKEEIKEWAKGGYDRIDEVKREMKIQWQGLRLRDGLRTK